MTEPSCKTCRWWGATVDRDYLKFFTGGRICTKQFAPNSQNWAIGVDHSADDDVQSGQIVTGGDFGCIHHEAKDG